MKPSSLKKVFGIPSYFPDNDSEYHIEMRTERTRRFRELLAKLETYWPDIDIIVIAQNWQDFELPEVKNNIRTFHYGKLGILGARKELRNRFLDSEYDYMIMLDDDAMITVNEPQAYLDEIDKHPNGFGAIRRAPMPSVLQFFAISKYIFRQVEFSDVDPEKGEGFEDDVFSATCWGRFPDMGFMFPAGWVNESSLHYFGPGKCPSTWSDERTYDWDHMRSFTRSQVKKLSPQFFESSNPSEVIDVVIPYVNCADSQWVRDYVRHVRAHNPTPVRFRPWGTLKYLLRGIAEYMPFVRDVVIIVARESQIPTWLNRENVRIVYHEDYIPEAFLPTFNSCTIETFLWNIPDLADEIVYFNDDMFPVGPMMPIDFFTDGVPHLHFTKPLAYSSRNIFRSQCRAGMDMITDALGLESFEVGKIIKPPHITAPITKASMQKIKELCEDKLGSTVSRTRLPNNINQYIYSYYNYFTDNYICTSPAYKYFEISESTINTITQTILKDEYQLLCLNDSDRIHDYAKLRYQLQQCFEKKFPEKCKYEV